MIKTVSATTCMSGENDCCSHASEQTGWAEQASENRLLQSVVKPAKYIIKQYELSPRIACAC